LTFFLVNIVQLASRRLRWRVVQTAALYPDVWFGHPNRRENCFLKDIPSQYSVPWKTKQPPEDEHFGGFLFSQWFILFSIAILWKVWYICIWWLWHKWFNHLEVGYMWWTRLEKCLLGTLDVDKIFLEFYLFFIIIWRWKNTRTGGGGVELCFKS
jgi:hypothetical protein